MSSQKRITTHHTTIIGTVIAHFCFSACGQFVPEFLSAERGKEKTTHSSDARNANNSPRPDPLDDKRLSEKVADLTTEAANLAGEISFLNNRLEQIFLVKNALCRRQTNLFSSCLAHTPLSFSHWKVGAACRNDRKIWDTRAYSANISGVDGKFKLVLDNSIESNSFEANRETKLSWVALGSRSLRDMKLSDIGSYKLKAVEGTFENLESVSFSLKIDDTILLSEKDIIVGTKTDTAVILSQIPISERLASSECRVEENEIEEITKKAISTAAAQPEVSSPTFESGESKQKMTSVIEDWIEQKRREYLNKTDIYLASAQDIARLRRDMRGNLQLGCWARESIKTIEVTIQGDHLTLGEWERNQAKQAIPTVGQPTQTTLDFGGGLRFTNSDEGSFSLFRQDGRWLINVNSDLTIGDISSVQLRKDGYAFQSLKNCWSTWGGLGSACEWQNREKDRYSLKALAIQINGQRIYTAENLNHTFERKSLHWFEKSLTSNQAYIELMRRRDCPMSAVAE
ncbi:MAG: hypothetical protein RLZZ488_1441 [Pseudomonadota bacterium]|jgi:hypothetical protein